MKKNMSGNLSFPREISSFLCSFCTYINYINMTRFLRKRKITDISVFIQAYAYRRYIDTKKIFKKSAKLFRKNAGKRVKKYL